MYSDERSKASGILKSYLEDAELVDIEDENNVSEFKYVNPEDREPNGFFDYILQTFVDFASEDMGGTNTLEFTTNSEVFDSYAKFQQLNPSVLCGTIMDRYQYNLEDPYERDDFGSGRTELGNSLSLFVNMIDYDGKVGSHQGNRYEKGLTEQQVNTAIERFYSE